MCIRDSDDAALALIDLISQSAVLDDGSYLGSAGLIGVAYKLCVAGDTLQHIAFPAQVTHGCTGSTGTLPPVSYTHLRAMSP